ncbi:MAG: hypothetical protein IPJ88_12570 [Myxococcales bacterium]|nr:MAG: hypothetical protein IPJ88_12570 [Myxococcales bacterium]
MFVRNVSALLLYAVLLGFCASGPEIRASSVFSEQDALSFDGGVDWVADPTLLEGEWYEQWYKELKERVSAADLIVKVTIRVIRSDTDLDGNQPFHLYASPSTTYKGQWSNGDLYFSSDPTLRGYNSIRSGKDNVLKKEFIAFVKWQNSDNRTVARFHLSQSSAKLLATVEEITSKTNDERNQPTRLF